MHQTLRQHLPHLDGIRAIAAIAVFAYHLFPNGLTGGFTGVDVFFVISGYLIIGRIADDLKESVFSFAGFFQRRIKRILPPAVTVSLTIVVAGWVCFPAATFFPLGSALTQSSIFCFNRSMYATGFHYGDQHFDLNPFMHFWTLSIEEQFYLATPIILFSIWKLNKKQLTWTLTLLAALSLTLAAHLVGHGYIHGAYYLPQYRAWEFMLGGILAISGINTDFAHPWVSFIRKHISTHPKVYLFTGLLLLIAPMVILTRRSPFPGLYALPTVLGTFLTIASGHISIGNRLLGNKLLASIGKLSYSIYLWHWPVIVYWNYATYNRLAFFDITSIITLTAILSWLTWRWIERPIQCKQWSNNQHWFSFAGASIVSLVFLGTLIGFHRGWPGSFHPRADSIPDQYQIHDPAEVRATLALLRTGNHWFHLGSQLLTRHDQMVQSQDVNYDLSARDNISQLGNPKAAPWLLLVGDSHAQALRYGINQLLYERGEAAISIAKPSAPLFDLTQPTRQPILNILDTNPSITTIVLCQKWLNYFSAQNSAENQVQTLTQIREFSSLIKNKQRDLIILLDVPEFEYSFTDLEPHLAIWPPTGGHPSDSIYTQKEDRYSTMQGDFNKKLRTLCETTNTPCIPMQDMLRQGDYYSSLSGDKSNKVSLFYDLDHFSRFGSVQAAHYLFAKMGEFANLQRKQTSEIHK